VFGRRSRFQAADDVADVVVVWDQLVGVGPNRRRRKKPDVRVQQRPQRQHADDREALRVDLHRPADDARIGLEARRPQLVREDQHVAVAAGGVLVRREVATEERLHAEDAEVLGRDLGAVEAHGIPVAREILADRMDRSDRLELCRLVFPVGEHAAVARRKAARRRLFGDLHETVRFRIG